MLDREHLGLADWACERNAFGRQVRSFEADLEIAGFDGAPVRAVFIRAPWIDEHGDGVEVLAEVDGHVGRRAAGQPARDRLPSRDRGRDPVPRAVHEGDRA